MKIKNKDMGGERRKTETEFVKEKDQRIERK